MIGLLAGRLPGSAETLDGGTRAHLVSFLRTAGFSGNGAILWRWRPALLAGWLLHVALLILIAGIAVQLSLYDRGLFEVAVGETAALQEPGVVFDRQSGLFAQVSPPAIKVGLLEFDPYRHQPGFAPDRISSLLVLMDGREYRLDLDRAKGGTVEGIKLYQGLVHGAALVLAFPGGDHRAVHLASVEGNLGSAGLTDALGHPFVVEVKSKNSFDSRKGTGSLSFTVRRGEKTTKLSLGDTVDVAGGPAQLTAVVRWSGFSYSKSPGMPAVVVGFSLVLASLILLLFPAGLARVSETGRSTVARVWCNRGLDVLLADWESSSGLLTREATEEVRDDRV